MNKIFETRIQRILGFHGSGHPKIHTVAKSVESFHPCKSVIQTINLKLLGYE